MYFYNVINILRFFYKDYILWAIKIYCFTTKNISIRMDYREKNLTLLIRWC